MQHLRKTPEFRGPRGGILPGSIAESRFVRLGGLEQWVMLRGESIENPPLIMLHGGPGMSETLFFRACNSPLEKAFTVAYWDQRGTGKSFNPKIPRATMTVAQFVADLDDLVEHVRARTGRRKVTIFGHSWGSVLGPLYAARFPHKVAAYVGACQIGDAAAGEEASYAAAISMAQTKHKRRALKKLEALGPPPYDAKALMKERTWVNYLEGRLNARTFWEMGMMYRRVPDLSIFEMPKVAKAFQFSLQAMWHEVSRLNLLELVPKLMMPTFFFLGRNDHWVVPEISLAYINALEAPSKRVIWFEQSNHELFADEPAKFNRSMIELVRPASVQ